MLLVVDNLKYLGDATYLVWMEAGDEGEEGGRSINHYCFKIVFKQVAKAGCQITYSTFRRDM